MCVAGRPTTLSCHAEEKVISLHSQQTHSMILHILFQISVVEQRDSQNKNKQQQQKTEKKRNGFAGALIETASKDQHVTHMGHT